MSDAAAIAVIGMSARLPGARDLNEAWNLIVSGRATTSSFSESDMRRAGVPTSLLSDPRLVRSGPALDGIDKFDADFFGYSPREAQLMDPQQRLFLEEAWLALEDAGYGESSEARSIGVFGSCSTNLYFLFNLFRNPKLMSGTTEVHPTELIQPGFDKDYLCSRVSYKLNLLGPSIVVQTACSSSLTAICLAVQSLLAFECDMALAGGVSVEFPGTPGAIHVEGGMLSPDGICRPFDKDASGSVFASGVGLIVLKRLEEALSSGDNIRAVIRGAAVNNDGIARASYEAPGVNGQARVIAEAFARAGLRPSDAGLIETHGSATSLGDPIEFAALCRAFGPGAKIGKCALGAAKGNFGHLNAAAGVLGVIKTILALEHRTIPPVANFRFSNARIELAQSPFYIPTVSAHWHAGGAKRIAGVSAFGLGGANAHLVVEEAPLSERGETLSNGSHVLPLSGRSKEALSSTIEQLADRLDADSDLHISDVARTLQSGRKRFNERLVVVAQSRREAVELLRTRSRMFNGSGDRPIAFMFSGFQRADPAWLAHLRANCEDFRDALDHCAELLLRARGVRLPIDQQAPSVRSNGQSKAEEPLEVRHAGVVASEYALSAVFKKAGIIPDAVLGHSLGEICAAVVGGALDLEAALSFVVDRARAIAEHAPRGELLAVPMSPEEVSLVSENGPAIAALNAPDLTVLSGTYDEIGAAEEALRKRGIASSRLNAGYPFHSPHLRDARAATEDAARRLPFLENKIPIYSSLTAQRTTREFREPGHWGRHLCEPVSFARAIGALRLDLEPLFVEIGPGDTLTNLVRQVIKTAGSAAISASPGLFSDLTPMESLLQAIAATWTAGKSPVWSELSGYSPGARLVSLPGYPFQRQKYWIDPVDAELPRDAQCEDARTAVENTERAERPLLNPSLRLQPATPRNHSTEEMLDIVKDAWADVLGVKALGPDDDFFSVGGHSLAALHLVTALWRQLKLDLPLRWVLKNPTPRKMADSLSQHSQGRGGKALPHASNQDLRLYVRETIADITRASAHPAVPGGELVDIAEVANELSLRIRRDFRMPVYPPELLHLTDIEQIVAWLSQELREYRGAAPMVAPAPSLPDKGRVRNVALILSSVRSGSTLLRVMLAGHSQIFSPPELHLLGYSDMLSRERNISDADRNQGLAVALKELAGSSLDAATARIETLTADETPIEDVYRLLTGLTKGRLFLDKSPGYSMKPDALAMAARIFERPRYIHLVRHPSAVVESIRRNRFHKLMGAGNEDAVTFGVHAWLRSNQNIIDFLEQVEPSQSITVRFEDLVMSPRAEMERVCAFLSVPFEESLLHPYEGSRMRDGLGDPNFLWHRDIDPTKARAPGGTLGAQPLPLPVLQLASRFHYEGPSAAPIRTPASKKPLPIRSDDTELVARLREGTGCPLVCIHAIDGDVMAYAPLSRHITARPVYAIAAGCIQAGDTFDALASRYADLVSEMVEGYGFAHLCGWSMGGLLATEISHQLEQRATIRAGHLSIIDSIPPGYDPAHDFSEQTMLSLFGRSLGVQLDDIIPRDLDDLRSWMIETDAAPWRHLDPASLADRYRQFCRLYPLVRGKRSFKNRAKDTWFYKASRSGKTNDALRRFWSDCSISHLQLVDVDADHFSIMRGSAVAEIGSHMSDQMSRLDRGGAYGSYDGHNETAAPI